jgi:hypothetical protein
MKKRSSIQKRAIPDQPTNLQPADVNHKITPANHSDMWHRVATRAYELYKERGEENGHDVEDWLKAEALIRAESIDGITASPSDNV